jgi:hypothetical protein
VNDAGGQVLIGSLEDFFAPPLRPLLFAVNVFEVFFARFFCFWAFFSHYAKIFFSASSSSFHPFKQAIAE